MDRPPSRDPTLPPPSLEYLEIENPGHRPVRLLYVVVDGQVGAIATSPTAPWLATLFREGRARLRWAPGPMVPARASPELDPARAERIRMAFRAKYGEARWRRHFDAHDRVLLFEPGLPAGPPDPLRRLREEFEAIAPTYQGDVERDPFERYLKGRTREALVERLAGIDPLLEIGPGTGWETLPLLAEGHRIVAVDIAPSMLAELGAAAARSGVGEHLTVREGRLGALEPLLTEFGAGSFGAVYSTFGAFNLEGTLDSAVRVLAALVRPGGPLVVASLNRPGWSAAAWELLVGNPRGFYARLRSRIPAPLIGYPLDVYPRSPTDLARQLAPAFLLRNATPVSVLTPPFPSDRLARWLAGSAGEIARRFDSELSRWRLARLAAEWVLVDLVRTGPTEPGGPAANGVRSAPVPRP